MPAAFMSKRNAHAATPITATLTSQMLTSHPRRLSHFPIVVCMIRTPGVSDTPLLP